jgi:hypothetical protein
MLRPILSTMSRRSLTVLLCSLGLLASACGAGSDGEAAITSEPETTTSTVAEATVADSDTDSNGQSSSGGLSSSTGGDASGNSDDTASSSDGGSDESAAPDLSDGMTSEVAAQAALTLEDAFPPEAEACVLDELANDLGLLGTVMMADEFSDLSDADQAEVVKISFACTEPGVMAGFMVQSFNEGSELEAPDEMGTCLEGKLSGPEGELVILGFIAVGNEEQPLSEARQPLIDTMSECLPGSLFADVISQSLGEDPTMADALDPVCVEDGYSTPGSMDSFWAAFVDNPALDFEDLPADVQADVIGPVLDCIQFGAVIAAEAEKDGVFLSDDSVTCIDEKIAESEMMSTIIAGGEPDQAAIAGAILGCLSSEELQQLGG